MSNSLARACHLALAAHWSTWIPGQRSGVIFEQLPRGAKAALLAWLVEHCGCRVLYVAPDSAEIGPLLRELQPFTAADALVYPEMDPTPLGEPAGEDARLVGERMALLSHLIDSKSPGVIAASLTGLLQQTYSPEALIVQRLQLVKGQQISPGELAARFQKMGYTPAPLAAESGEFALRTNLIDVIAAQNSTAYRIECWGDEIDSIRTFDPRDQRSLDEVALCEVLPASEGGIAREESGRLIDFALQAATEPLALVLDDLAGLEDCQMAMSEGPQATADIKALCERAAFKAYLLSQPLSELGPARRQQTPEGVATEFSLLGCELSGREMTSPFVALNKRFGPPLSDRRETALAEIERAAAEGFAVYIARANRADGDFAERLIATRELAGLQAHYADGYLEEGFALEASRVLITSTVCLTGHIALHRPKAADRFSDPLEGDLELEMGEFVVHQHNGIGRFRGIERRRNHLGDEAEFMKVEYAERAHLYVPLQQTHLIDRFIGGKEELPRLHALGSNRWKSQRAQTQGAIDAYAQRLLEMHAERSLQKGSGFGVDSEAVGNFEGAFPYVLTIDQAEAIAAIKRDLASAKFMDRLVCGDVGFGKTEVAMRAAVKTVLDGKRQVAVLVPTTVLALQHFETFSERMSSFPVRIGHLSRFTPSSAAQRALEQLRVGDLDIVIGTHRLLGRDVAFRDLGLVVIDEEQRFGVRAKEQLRHLKSSAHCLTLSATPIPRTLYLSLVGARDLSSIETPPQDRHRVNTIIAPLSDELIAGAIARELKREGQIFVVHNRVESLGVWRDKLERLAPGAQIAVAHGRMSAEEIDRVFHAFKRGQAQILLATSIIENGIDIPNANTIIVDRSDTFGLADLHQLRGRVGRWNRRAFAYFLYSDKGVLPEIAAKRLRALSEASGPGGGMKIAMRDLQIRGSGQILGVQQSGHASAIGFHLYCKLLKRTLDGLRGKQVLNTADVKVEIDCDARIPDEYVDDVSLRMHLYRRLGECESCETIDALGSELRDRFGPFPRAVKFLLSIARIRARAAAASFTIIKLAKATGQRNLAQLHLEKTSEGPLPPHRTNLPMPGTPEELERVLMEQLEAMANRDHLARQQRVAAALRQRHRAQPLKNLG